MTLDMNKILATKKALTERVAKSTGNTYSSVIFWKPKAGKNTVRVMPCWTDQPPFAGQFWREVHQHWEVAENQAGPVICPVKTPHAQGEKDCPICAFVDELRADKTNVEAQELAKKIRAKIAYLVNIVDLSDPVYTAKDVAEAKQAKPDADLAFEVGDPKIQVYAAPTSVFSAILGVIQDNELDITNLKEGNDLFITKNGSGLTTKYEVSLKVKQSASDVSPSTVLPDLTTVGINLDSGKMKELLTQGVGGSYVATLPSGNVTTVALPAAVKSVPKNVSKQESSPAVTQDLEAELRAALSRG